MKAKRWILIISGIICILFILLSAFTPNGTKINNICIGIMGSSIVSFAITLLDYFCEKNKIKAKMYLLSIALYRNMIQMQFNLNDALTKNEIILESFLEFTASNVEKNYNEINLLDDEIYTDRENIEKYKWLLFDINTAFKNNQLMLNTIVLDRKINVLRSGQKERGITALEMREELMDLISKNNMYIDKFENTFKLILNKNEKTKFAKERSIIENVLNNFSGKNEFI